jgi:hypothetical protein
LQLKTGSLFKSWNTFHFKLTPESLQYYKKATDAQREGVILIASIKAITVLTDNKRSGRRFDISVGAKNQIYGLLAENKAECDVCFMRLSRVCLCRSVNCYFTHLF